MKFALSVLVYALIAGVLALSIWLAVPDSNAHRSASYWPLAASLACYILAFAGYGCRQH